MEDRRLRRRHLHHLFRPKPKTEFMHMCLIQCPFSFTTSISSSSVNILWLYCG